MCGSPNTSPTGRHARSCWPRQAHVPKPATPTKSQSVSSATPPSAASCSSVHRRCRVAQTQSARTNLGPTNAGIACVDLESNFISQLENDESNGVRPELAALCFRLLHSTLDESLD